MRGLRTGWRLAFFALLGGVMGTVLDALHVLNETALYLRVAKLPVLDVAWYVPVEFVGAGVTVGLLRPELDEQLWRKRSDLPLSHVLAGMFALTVAWFGSGWLTSHGVSNGEILAILAPGALICWAALDRTWQGGAAAALTAAIGVVVEAGLVKTGTYLYLKPDFWGLPMWLPALYCVACVAVGNLGRYMKYSWDLRRDEHEVAAPDRQVA